MIRDRYSENYFFQSHDMEYQGQLSVPDHVSNCFRCYLNVLTCVVLSTSPQNDYGYVKMGYFSRVLAKITDIWGYNDRSG